MNEDESENDYCDLQEDMYVVQKVLQKKTYQIDGKRKIYYLVKWQNYPDSQNSWEPEEHLAYCPQVIQLFERKRNEKKRKDPEQQHNNKFEETKKEISPRKELKPQGIPSDPIDLEEKPRKMLKKDSGEVNKKSSGAAKVQKDKNSLQAKPGKERQQNTYQQNDVNRRYQDILKSYLTPNEKQPQRKQKNHKQQKPDSLAERYGKTVNHVYENGKIFYEVERLSADKKVVKIDRVGSEFVEKNCLKSSQSYLQKLLIKLEQQSLKQY